MAVRAPNDLHSASVPRGRVLLVLVLVRLLWCRLLLVPVVAVWRSRLRMRVLVLVGGGMKVVVLRSVVAPHAMLIEVCPVVPLVVCLLRRLRYSPLRTLVASNGAECLCRGLCRSRCCSRHRLVMVVLGVRLLAPL